VNVHPRTFGRTVSWLSAAFEKLKNVSKEHSTMYDYSHLTLAGWNDGVARDQLCEDTTGSVDTENKRVDIDEDRHGRCAFITSEDSALGGGTVI
jgi:hypothetical protein